MLTYSINSIEEYSNSIVYSGEQFHTNKQSRKTQIFQFQKNQVAKIIHSNFYKWKMKQKESN